MIELLTLLTLVGLVLLSSLFCLAFIVENKDLKNYNEFLQKRNIKLAQERGEFLGGFKGACPTCEPVALENKKLIKKLKKARKVIND